MTVPFGPLAPFWGSFVVCSVQSVECNVRGNLQCAVCSVKCAVCSFRCAVVSVQLALGSVQCTVCSVKCTVGNVQCAVCSMIVQFYGTM